MKKKMNGWMNEKLMNGYLWKYDGMQLKLRENSWHKISIWIHCGFKLT